MEPRDSKEVTVIPFKTKSKHVVTKVVPWFNKAEWEAVYHSLYSSNIKDQRWAVDRISAWKCRSHPTLPLGIDATAAIVRARIQDYLMSQNVSMYQPADVSLLYAMALVRFVNTLSEHGQCREHKTSVRSIAYKFGIPEWVIDLRHNATHSSLPSLKMLQLGANFAMSWLKEYCWEPEREFTSDWIPHRTTPPSSDIQSIILSFQQNQFELLYSCDDLKRKKIIMKEILDQMRNSLIMHHSLFIQTLVEPGYLLPLPVHLEAILDKNEKVFLEDDVVKLPHSLQKFWQPVLVLIHRNKLIQNLLEALLMSQSNKDKLIQRLAVSWVKEILEVIISKKPVQSLLQGLLQDKPCLDWFRLLAASLKSPSKYSPAVLPLIVGQVEPPLSTLQKNHALALVAIYLGAVTDEKVSFDDDMSSRIFDVEDLKIAQEMEDKNIEEFNPSTSKSNKRSEWKLSSEEIDWGSFPLGAILNISSGDQFSSVNLWNDGPKMVDAAVLQVDETTEINNALDSNTSLQDEMQMEEFTEDIIESAEKNIACLPDNILVL